MKNVIFWIGVINNNASMLEKHGNFEYFKYSKSTWKYWCEKNDIVFYEYTTPSNSNLDLHKPTWQRWFDVFLQLKAANINYNKICLVDASVMIHWDAPNFFDLCPNNKLTAYRSLENITWINQSMNGYKDLFDNTEYDLKKYINCGLQIFDNNHEVFLKTLEKFYNDNYTILSEKERVIKRGTDQPIYNHLIQKYNIDVNHELPSSFHLTHMTRFNWFSHNWQLNEDNTPYFIKYGYIWSYSGFDRRQRNELMKQTWEIIKQNYE